MKGNREEKLPHFEPIFVARQPIFDRRMGVWGYELLFRHSGQAKTAEITDANAATAKVIVDGFSLAFPGFRTGAKALINFPADLLLADIALALPPEVAVIEILETVPPSPEIVAACAKLKIEGFQLALDDFVGQPGYEPLLEMADIVKVDVLNVEVQKLEPLVKRLNRFRSTLLAEKVESKEQLDAVKKIGFELFQGFFFSRPVVVPGRKIATGMAAKLKLLNELSRRDFDLSRVAEIIQSDVSLSYRLILYINSASFALREKVDSIPRALLLMGNKSLMQWLRVVIMADLNPTTRGFELVHLSVLRAKFLQLLSDTGRTPFPSDSMFLLGFFSLLDALMEQPMEEILEHLPLEEDLLAALTDETNPGQAWIALVEAFEKGRWDRANALMKRLGLSAEKTAVQYSQAMAWTAEVLRSGKEEKSE